MRVSLFAASEKREASETEKNGCRWFRDRGHIAEVVTDEDFVDLKSGVSRGHANAIKSGVDTRDLPVASSQKIGRARGITKNSDGVIVSSSEIETNDQKMVLLIAGGVVGVDRSVSNIKLTILSRASIG